MIKEDLKKYLENNMGTIVSDIELSKKLNISRTAIWKAINTLKNEGYNIKSVSNTEYVLNTKNNVISENIIKNNLKTTLLGNKIEILKTIDSTNNYLKMKASEEFEGFVVISEHQTKGKGRMGREFFSPINSGIYMSILLKPCININDINIITVMASISVLKALETKINVKLNIKWVNDILYKNKKLCGILAETSIESGDRYVEYVIVGIGINTNIYSENIPSEIKDIIISLEEITGKYYDRNEIISEILNQFEYNYKSLVANGKHKIIDIYRQNLSMIGEEIKVIQGLNTYYAQILDINENAELIVKDRNGKILTLNSGEISIKMT